MFHKKRFIAIASIICSWLFVMNTAQTAQMGAMVTPGLSKKRKQEEESTYQAQYEKNIQEQNKLFNETVDLIVNKANVYQIVNNSNELKNINMQNHEGNTLLHFASVFGPTAAEFLLFNPSINKNIKNNNKETPLMLAINHKNTNLVKALLVENDLAWFIAQNKDLDLNFYDINGLSPLRSAMIQLVRSKNEEEQKEWIKVIHLLLQRGASPNLENGEGDTAISDFDYFYEYIAPRLSIPLAQTIEEYLKKFTTK